MKTKLLLAFVLVSLLGIMESCEKDPIAKGPVAGEYLISTPGSSWTYALSGSKTADWEVKAEDSSFIYQFNTYRQFKSNYVGTGAVINNYYRYNQGNYTTLVKDAENVYQEIVYLKDSTQTGKRWTKAIKGAGGIMQEYRYEVMETISKTVAGINYDRVVHIQLTIPNLAYTADAYYAPNVGLVQLDEDYASSGNTYHTELKSKSLK